MLRTHNFFYTPLMVGASKRYIIKLPVGVSPVTYKTMTSPMHSWLGEVIKTSPDGVQALLSADGRTTEVTGWMCGAVQAGEPCYIMEHLNIDGEMDLMIGNENILQGSQNFVNYGIPGGKHLRIDIYNGESKLVNDGNR